MMQKSELQNPGIGAVDFSAIYPERAEVARVARGGGIKPVRVPTRLFTQSEQDKIAEVHAIIMAKTDGKVKSETTAIVKANIAESVELEEARLAEEAANNPPE
jgi:hypothetical protein